MAKEKKERADKYEKPLKTDKTFKELIKIAANPKPKKNKKDSSKK